MSIFTLPQVSVRRLFLQIPPIRCVVSPLNLTNPNDIPVRSQPDSSISSELQICRRAGPASGPSSQDDGGLDSEQARDGQRQGDAAGAGRAAARRVRARALRAPDPHIWPQRHRHVPHRLWRLRLWDVPGRPGE
jgi:hypothetical protein